VLYFWFPKIVEQPQQEFLALPELFKIVILAVVQGLAELLPVSSSAHVIVAEKLLGKDPSSPEMTLLLVMLHTGTMFAVIVYFCRAWRSSIFGSLEIFKQQAIRLIVATALTGAIGYPLIKGIEKGLEKSGYLVRDASGKLPKAEIETLFSNLSLVAGALAAAGVLILVAGLAEKATARNRPVGIWEAAWIGAVQGLCLPFRGFSRSGSTISTGLLLGVVKARVEEFSFALAVIITPAAIGREVLRLIDAHKEATGFKLTMGLFAPSLVGMVFAFLAGLLALKWLSRWLENGRWFIFGVYCLAAAGVVYGLYLEGV
jgi:undecaprenyl-diphosphatase